MFVQNQKVILPKSHGEKEGIVTVIPKKLKPQTGLMQMIGRVKVSYQDGNGGLTEAWFEIDKLSAWRKPADITAELEARHKLEMEKVSKEFDREKLDWIEPVKEAEPIKETKPESGLDDNSEQFIG